VIDTPNEDANSVVLEIKARSLLNLYYFAKTVLGYNLLVDHLHLPLSRHLQQRKKQVVELPRGHFKTTLASKSLPIWRALPIESEVVDYMLSRQMIDEDGVEAMKEIHSPNTRILIVSSTDDNAKKILRAVRYTFENNQLFRALYPSLLPDTKSKWNDSELCLNRTEFYSESTFEAVGAGTNLQSRHYDFIIEDDLVGKEDTESESVMKKKIDYHVLLEGCYDRPETADSLVIGNRWAFNDLNSWIRENESQYEFHTMAAIIDDQALFPERFSLADLNRIRRKQGDYTFSCQYLNNPIAPGAHDFELSWLKEWKWVIEKNAQGVETKFLLRDDGRKVALTQLNRYVLIDPNREGKATKARHAIIAMGVDSESNHWILRTWAEKCTTERMLRKGFEFYDEYKCQKMGIEGFGGDSHLKGWMDYMARVENKRARVVVFSKSTTRSKEERVRACQPKFEMGQVATPENEFEFRKEYQEFPSCVTWDLLDAYAHAEEIARRPVADDEYATVQKIYNNLDRARNAQTGY
jgi:hypothetical protein